jgi:hypothetical protein
MIIPLFIPEYQVFATKNSFEILILFFMIHFTLKKQKLKKKLEQKKKKKQEYEC